MKLKSFRDHRFEPMTANFDDKDVMLYALGVGVGYESTDAKELNFVYERDLKALPSMAAVLAHPGAWITADKFEVNWLRLLHGEQRVEFEKPLPDGGRVRGEYRVSAIVDKGAEKGSLVYFEKQLIDAATEEKICTVTSTYFLRADGGAGGFGDAPDALPDVPDSPPDFIDEVAVSRRAALLYRLNGDRNPIHADPEMAKKAGFDAPILHGLCTYGICGYAVLRNGFDGDPARLSSLDVRFSAPVKPGETLSIEGWRLGSGIAFQANVKERGQRVISNGFAKSV